MSLRWAWVASLAVIAAASCAEDESVTPLGRRSAAGSLGFFARERAADPLDEARLALERDARFREARFLDAASPGYLLAATRVGQREIDAGLVPPGELWELGAQLFTHSFRTEEGLGGADAPFPRRVHGAKRGGPDAVGCATCHWRGGLAGAGDGSDTAFLQGDGDAPASALARDPIALTGAGWVELLAQEMTRSLHAQRAGLLLRAAAEGGAVRGELVTKGVSFGWLTARPDGGVDGRELVGIDADLVVRPFGHKGNVATLRDAVEEALALHHGMQSTWLVATAPSEVLGPFGARDPDGDGVVDEITEGQVTALTVFAALSEVPVEDAPASPLVPTTMLATGRAAFTEIGCAACHVASLRADTSVFELPSREGGATLALDLATEGASPRLTTRGEDGTYDVPLYSDLKRHDLGDALAEARPDRGTSGRLFLTRPLWGLSRTAPYLHDGRAPTLHDAITAHDGEARAAREAYEALGEAGQAPIRVFLQSLTRAPAYVVR